MSKNRLKVADAKERLSEESLLDFQVVNTADLRLLLKDHTRLELELANLHKKKNNKKE